MNDPVLQKIDFTRPQLWTMLFTFGNVALAPGGTAEDAQRVDSVYAFKAQSIVGTVLTPTAITNLCPANSEYPDGHFLYGVATAIGSMPSINSFGLQMRIGEDIASASYVPFRLLAGTIREPNILQDQPILRPGIPIAMRAQNSNAATYSGLVTVAIHGVRYPYRA